MVLQIATLLANNVFIPAAEHKHEDIQKDTLINMFKAQNRIEQSIVFDYAMPQQLYDRLIFYNAGRHNDAERQFVYVYHTLYEGPLPLTKEAFMLYLRWDFGDNVLHSPFLYAFLKGVSPRSVEWELIQARIL